MTNKLSEMLIVMAEIYGEELTEARLDAYKKVLNDMNPKELEKAFESIMNNPWIKKIPLPAEIKFAARPQLKPRDEAIRRLSLIKEAIRKHGFYSPQEGRKFLGEIIWGDVCRMGGWRHLCESPDANLRDSITYAQIRDGLTSSVQAERDGINYEAPALPGAKNKILEIVQDGANKLSLEGDRNANTDNQGSGGLSPSERREDN